MCPRSTTLSKTRESYSPPIAFSAMTCLRLETTRHDTTNDTSKWCTLFVSELQPNYHLTINTKPKKTRKRKARSKLVVRACACRTTRGNEQTGVNGKLNSLVPVELHGWSRRACEACVAKEPVMKFKFELRYPSFLLTACPGLSMLNSSLERSVSLQRTLSNKVHQEHRGVAPVGCRQLGRR